MLVIDVRNVQEALPTALALLANNGVERPSRNGPVKRFPGPVTTAYQQPTERVMFWGQRDANPFFHFFESLWMLAGRRDVAFVQQFVPRMATFSDNGKVFHAAYGHRWRSHFDGLDQIKVVVEALKANHDDRRCVVQMWDATADLGKEGKDFPCNTQIMFEVGVEGALNMTVLNRSNDIVWGAYGANAVHMSFLQEYVAALVGVPVGIYYQVSNNLHAYLDTMGKVAELAEIGLPNIGEFCPYRAGQVEPYPIFDPAQSNMKTWEEDLMIFLTEGPIVGLRDPFFRKVATPMWMAWRSHKAKRYEAALEIMQQCRATDWRLACNDWLVRRMNAYEQKREKETADD